MDRRIKYLDRLLAAYASGDFDKRLKLSDRLDDTDAVFSAFHMLAEELKAVTISRDYFNVIFDAVGDMIFVLSEKGLIEDLNAAACDRLGYVKKGLIGRMVDVLAGETRPPLWSLLRSRRGVGGKVGIWDRSLLTAGGMLVPVEMTARPLPFRGTKGNKSVLLMAKDIGPRLAEENRMLRAVIEAQEVERMRLARDLHDGLGQQLTAACFLVGVAIKESVLAPTQEKLQATLELLLDVSTFTQGVRNNLVSKTLADFGLVPATMELAQRMERAGVLRVRVEEPRGLPAIDPTLETDIFRVIQEFMGNAIKHGQATLMQIRFRSVGTDMEVRLKENGKGFELARVQGAGNGLRNMYSRIRSHEGVFLLRSLPGKGTEAMIRVAIKP